MKIADSISANKVSQTDSIIGWSGNMEVWDIYDKDRQVTGKQMYRGDIFEQGAYHLVIHVCLFNPLGEILIKQRQPDKQG